MQEVKKNMKNLFQRFKWMGILLGILLILAGIGIIVLGILSPDKVNLILSITIAVICFIIGIIYIVAGVMVPLSEFYSSLYLYGAFAIAIGIILLVHQDLSSEILIYTISVVLITLGVVYIVRGILYLVNKLKLIQIILAFVVGGVALTLGIIALIFRGQMLQVIYVMAGAFMVLSGILQLIDSAKGKSNKNQEN